MTKLALTTMAAVAILAVFPALPSAAQERPCTSNQCGEHQSAPEPYCGDQLGVLKRVLPAEVLGVNDGYRVWVTEFCPSSSLMRSDGNAAYLRTAIAKLKDKSETAPQRAVAEESLSAGKDYLYRYYKLIAFENYLKEMSPQGFPQDFSSWICQHPELDVSPDSLELAFNYVTGSGEVGRSWRGGEAFA